MWRLGILEGITIAGDHIIRFGLGLLFRPGRRMCSGVGFRAGWSKVIGLVGKKTKKRGFLGLLKWGLRMGRGEREGEGVWGPARDVARD
jgi:hypothetical protein